MQTTATLILGAACLWVFLCEVCFQRCSVEVEIRIKEPHQRLSARVRSQPLSPCPWSRNTRDSVPSIYPVTICPKLRFKNSSGFQHLPRPSLSLPVLERFLLQSCHLFRCCEQFCYPRKPSSTTAAHSNPVFWLLLLLFNLMTWFTCVAAGQCCSWTVLLLLTLHLQYFFVCSDVWGSEPWTIPRPVNLEYGDIGHTRAGNLKQFKSMCSLLSQLISFMSLSFTDTKTQTLLDGWAFFGLRVVQVFY